MPSRVANLRMEKAMKIKWIFLGMLGVVLVGGVFSACRREAPVGGKVVVYSGRSLDLMQELFDRFTTETGISVEVRYGSTSELAATLLEEGSRSPADVFLAQDAGALGAVSKAGKFMVLPERILGRVAPRFRSPKGEWVGVSGRARVLVYNPERVAADRLPGTMEALCDAEWKNRLGWAPQNASFQAFVTSLRVMSGGDASKAWLRCMKDNGVRDYAKNTAIVAAVVSGEIDAGLVNHYYLHTMEKERGAEMGAKNHYFPSGTLINVAGVGVIAGSEREDTALRLVEFLLSEGAQRYFSDETFEFPLLSGVNASDKLPALAELSATDMDLNLLEDLEGTLKLLQEAGAL
jgi:iron(III) transport system substrate-binding protein